jgi:hypothetical protein
MIHADRATTRIIVRTPEASGGEQVAHAAPQIVTVTARIRREAHR